MPNIVRAAVRLFGGRLGGAPATGENALAVGGAGAGAEGAEGTEGTEGADPGGRCGIPIIVMFLRATGASSRSNPHWPQKRVPGCMEPLH